MRVKFIFDAGQQSGGSALTLESLARGCIELQRLWVFMIYLAFEEISIIGNESVSDFQLLRYLLANPLEQRLNLLVEYDIRRLFWPFDPTLDVKIIRYESPLRIEAASKIDTPVPVNTSRLKSVFKVVMKVLTIDLIREKAHWETEITRQRAIEAALKNQERALNLAKKIKNPNLREEFIRNMASCIASLSRTGDHKLEIIELQEPSD